MNKIILRIFKNKEVNNTKLLPFGFAFDNGAYVYKTQIADGQFELCVKINNGDITTQVTETETNEPYTLFLADGATGSFVGEVRAEYEKILIEIAEKCCDTRIFKCAQSNQIINYIEEKYGDKLEFLWEKFDDNAVWRRKDNNKWYGVILTVSGAKLGLPTEEKLEVADLRIKPEDMEITVDNRTFFHGYHMNKKHWISVILDGSADINKIYDMIDTSYILAKK